MKIGTNIEASVVDGNKLVLVIDLTQDFGPSKSGKTITVASSNGFAKLADVPGVSLNLNLARKPA